MTCKSSVDALLRDTSSIIKVLKKSRIKDTQRSRLPYIIVSLPHELKALWRSAEFYDIRTEMATWLVSEELEFHLVPPTVIRSLDRQAGVLQLLVEPGPAELLHSIQRKSLDRQLQLFFDFVIGRRADSYLPMGRKPSHNYFYSDAGLPVSVENNQSFNIDFWIWQSVYLGHFKYNDQVLPSVTYNQEKELTDITSRIHINPKRYPGSNRVPLRQLRLEESRDEFIRKIHLETIEKFEGFLMTSAGRRIIDNIKNLDRQAFRVKLRQYLNDRRVDQLMIRMNSILLYEKGVINNPSVKRAEENFFGQLHGGSDIL